MLLQTGQEVEKKVNDRQRKQYDWRTVCWPCFRTRPAESRSTDRENQRNFNEIKDLSLFMLRQEDTTITVR